MATTTNFGWETPDDTDLVKDGALAMRTLGNAIDASMVDLKGGTTGQILSKNSNTDMDFVWTTPNPGDITSVGVSSPITGGGTSGDVTIGIQDATTAQKGAVQLTDSTSSTSTTTAATPNSVKSSYDLANAAIPKSTVTTNGDLIYGTGSAAVTRLGIGSTGQILTVSGGVPTWATAASSGGLTLITNTTMSTVTEVDFTSISSSYKSLILSCENIAQTVDNENFYIRFNGLTANDTYFHYRIINDPGATPTLQGINSGGSSSLITLGGFSNFDNTNAVSIMMEFPFYGSAGYKLYRGWAGGIYGTNANPMSVSVEGVAKTTNAITSIKVYVSTGTFKAQGNIKLYGVN